MKASLLLLLALVAPLSAQELLKLPTLTTKAGKTYKSVTVTAKRDDGISIMHEGGSTRIRFEDLPYSITSKLGPFDADKAKELRAQEEAKQKAMLDDIERGMAEKKRQDAEKATEEPARDTSKAPVKSGPQDNQKITARVVKYQKKVVGDKLCDRYVEVTARAGDADLIVRYPGGNKTVLARQTQVFNFWADEAYEVVASEGGKVVDRESARKKQGLTTDNKL